MHPSPKTQPEAAAASRCQAMTPSAQGLGREAYADGSLARAASLRALSAALPRMFRAALTRAERGLSDDPEAAALVRDECKRRHGATTKEHAND